MEINRSRVTSIDRKSMLISWRVRRAKCMMNVTVVGVGDEESTTWKSSDLQGVGPMGMPADDPLAYSKVVLYCVVFF